MPCWCLAMLSAGTAVAMPGSCSRTAWDQVERTSALRKFSSRIAFSCTSDQDSCPGVLCVVSHNLKTQQFTTVQVSRQKAPYAEQPKIASWSYLWQKGLCHDAACREQPDRKRSVFYSVLLPSVSALTSSRFLCHCCTYSCARL